MLDVVLCRHAPHLSSLSALEAEHRGHRRKLLSIYQLYPAGRIKWLREETQETAKSGEKKKSPRRVRSGSYSQISTKEEGLPSQELPGNSGLSSPYPIPSLCQSEQHMGCSTLLCVSLHTSLSVAHRLYQLVVYIKIKSRSSSSISSGVMMN